VKISTLVFHETMRSVDKNYDATDLTLLPRQSLIIELEALCYLTTNKNGIFNILITQASLNHLLSSRTKFLLSPAQIRLFIALDNLLVDHACTYVGPSYHLIACLSSLIACLLFEFEIGLQHLKSQ